MDRRDWKLMKMVKRERERERERLETDEMMTMMN